MEFWRYMLAQAIGRAVRIFGFTLLVQLGINIFGSKEK
jgi:hypothetical protein